MKANGNEVLLFPARTKLQRETAALMMVVGRLDVDAIRALRQAAEQMAKSQAVSSPF